MKANKFLNPGQTQQVITAIKNAELKTSGEIRLHIESKCKEDALQRAIAVFKKLKMHETELHNGTLIYLATEDRKFAVLGDRGINEKVPENFWVDIQNSMTAKFKEGDFVAGLTAGIEMIGKKLKEFFPYQDDDTNELPDDISIGE